MNRAAEQLRKHQSWIALVLLLFAGIMFGGCVQAKPKLKEYSRQYFDYFDTFSSITIYAESEEQFQMYEELVHKQLKRYHQLFDIYQEYDGLVNICTINRAAGIGAVAAEPEILELLERSEELYDLTGGKVNLALGSVLKIWHEYRMRGIEKPETAQLPEKAVLLAAAEYTDIHSIEIDREKSSVYLPEKKLQLDVGAVAKGYAAHKICEQLRAEGVSSALVNLGGNVQTIGTKPDGKPWRVGVQNPDITSQNGYLYAVKLQDMALVTSGSYQRFYEVDGKRYHHIIDPDSLMPKNTFAGVTILAKDGMMADALSTAVFNMDWKEGQALIEALPEVEAIWVYSDGSEKYSSGFLQYTDS